MIDRECYGRLLLQVFESLGPIVLEQAGQHSIGLDIGQLGHELGTDPDPHVQRLAGLLVGAGQEGVDVQLLNPRVTLGQLGDAQQGLLEQRQIGTRLAAHTLEQLEALDPRIISPASKGVRGERRKRTSRKTST